MAKLTGEALAKAMLESKQAGLARMAAAGKDISGYDPNVIMLEGREVGGYDRQIPPPADGVQEASLGALIPAAGAAASALGLPTAVLTALGIAGAGYGLYQALGGGEGGGLFGLDILGGSDYEYMMGGVPFGGPGLAEPLMPYKEWHITTNGTRLQFYSVETGRGKRLFCYNTNTKEWSTWRPHRPVVIGKKLPSHQMLTRLRRYLKKHSDDANTILKITQPASYLKAKGYYKRKRR